MTNKKQHCILVINTGSSSVKFQVFSRSPSIECLARGGLFDLGHKPTFITTGAKENLSEKKELTLDYSHEDAMHFILHWVQAKSDVWQFDAVAHRVVHGGTQFKGSVVLTPEVMTYLRQLCPLAPLHQWHNLIAINIFSTLRPNLIQVACFDTAFHAQHTPLFTEYALAQGLRDKGIRRYGFHGLSYEWIACFLKNSEPKLAQGRIIAAHLGSGASLCAMQNGISIDTTMGMTALDGLPMGTRCGAIDPGVLIYMMRELNWSADEVESILYHQSGLLGLSGWTHDVRLLQDSEDSKAQFALDYFCIKTAQLMGVMAVALGGVDGIVFTGGIGENSSFIRDNIVKHLDFLKPFEVRVIKANEEEMMAMHAVSVLENYS